jgi:TolB-like protein/Tfp pilus assembly protein PilF
LPGWGRPRTFALLEGGEAGGRFSQSLRNGYQDYAAHPSGSGANRTGPMTDQGADTVAVIRDGLAGRYTIQRELGRGGMSVVYLAHDDRHDRAVAIKVLTRDLVASSGAERFLREIRIAARLTHPHVLGMHDSGEAGGLLYYVMPFVEGETLRARLVREGSLSLAEAVRLLRELADALAHAHGHGVVHRDLKPENVLLAGGHAVVADFGIAKAVASATQDARGSAATLTATGVALGTPAYMAPEQAIGDHATDHRADLYALGVIAYELLAGVHPFGSRTAPALVAAHLTESPPPIRMRRTDVPPVLAALVMQLLAKDPAARPPNAESVLGTLDEVGASRAVAERSWRPILLGAAALVLLALGVAGYAFWRGSRAQAASNGAAQTATATIQKLAVLPFANTSGEEADDYFSDGLTDELAHALVRLPGVRLAGRTSSFAFKGRAAPAAEIRNVLDVDAFIDGTVRRAGDRLRVTTQLVSTADGKVLWDSVFESRSQDVFAVQDEFTRAIVAALAPSLGAGGSTAGRPVPADVPRGTSNSAAYDLYLKGRYHFLARGEANVARAILYLREAIALDPTFARAHAALAFAFAALPVYVSDASDSAGPRVEEYARRAVSLDSSLADAHAAMGLALEQQLRFAEAERSYRAALAREPSVGFLYHAMSFVLLNQGRTEEAIVALQQSTNLDPLAKSARSALSHALLHARRYPEAMETARQVLALDAAFPIALRTLGYAEVFGAEPEEAVRTLERVIRLHPEGPGQRMGLVLAYAAAGRWDDAQRLRASLQQPGSDKSRGIEPAVAELVFGHAEPLIRLLSATEGQKMWLRAVGTLGCNPFLDPLWSDPRFREAMDRLSVPRCPLARPWPIAPRPATTSAR